MDFWRGPAYTAFFEYLDSKGGFYYEVPSLFRKKKQEFINYLCYQRWGDAPVHSMAAALFASRDQIHFFDDIGYQHDPYTHCTNNKESWRKGRCTCDPAHSFGKITFWCVTW